MIKLSKTQYVNVCNDVRKYPTFSTYTFVKHYFGKINIICKQFLMSYYFFI